LRRFDASIVRGGNDPGCGEEVENAPADGAASVGQCDSTETQDSDTE